MRKTRIFALLLVLSLLLTGCGSTQTPLERTAEYLKTAVPEPDFGSLDGDWIVFGLARAGADLSDDYFERYYSAVEAAVQAADGKLDENRYTEYSRLILALTAIGRRRAASSIRAANTARRSARRSFRSGKRFARTTSSPATTNLR